MKKTKDPLILFFILKNPILENVYDPVPWILNSVCISGFEAFQTNLQRRRVRESEREEESEKVRHIERIRDRGRKRGG